jgi:hypothetical protein
MRHAETSHRSSDRDTPTAPLVTLSEAAGRLATATGCPRVHTATLTRWISRGVRGRRLPAVRVGGRLMVSPSDLMRFVEIRNADPSSPPLPAGIIAGQLELETSQLDALLGRDSEHRRHRGDSTATVLAGSRRASVRLPAASKHPRTPRRPK